jgi:hypothetical protein
MPRTCLACKSPERKEIDQAIVAGEALRTIAKRVSLSPAALFRHKDHVATAIVKAGEKREERHGDSLLDGMKAIHTKGWELLAKMESDGDSRGAVVALREVRECWQSLGAMLEKAQGSGHAEVRVVIEHVGAPGA